MGRRRINIPRISQDQDADGILFWNQEVPLSRGDDHEQEIRVARRPREKKVSFDKLSDHAYAYTAEGDPNTGIVVGDDAVMVIDTQATPVMAQDVDPAHPRGHRQADPLRRAVALPRGARARRVGLRRRARHREPRHVRPHRRARRADMKSEIERFPRLFRAVESVPGLTWPTLVFKSG